MSDIEPLSDDIGFLLVRASATMRSSASVALAPFDLRVRTYSTLMLACERTEGVHQRRIADVLALDPSQVVALVDELEHRGLIVRTADPADRRHKLVAATADGAVLCRAALGEVRRSHDESLAVLGDDAADLLRKTLQQFVFPTES